MQTWVLTVQFLLGVSAVLFLLWPLLSGGESQTGESADDSRRSFHRSLLQSLSDIEYEHETGKLSDRDYKRLRRHFMQKAHREMTEQDLKQLEDEIQRTRSAGEEPDPIEALVREARSRIQES